MLNAAIVYGGGQVPPANYTIAMIAQELMCLGYNVYGVMKSFLGMGDIACYQKFTPLTVERIKTQIGTYLGTCRKVYPEKEPYFNNIISVLKRLDIHTIFIPGGDGSSRASYDFLQKCDEIGYELQIIFIPCTIDGIPSSDTIGIDSAEKESTKRTIAMIKNAIATWNPFFKVPRTAIIEIQGRNRNDIAVRVMRNLLISRELDLNEINLIFIPAAHKWSFNALLERIYSDDRPTVIIASEGAVPTEDYWDAIVGRGIGEKLESLIKFGEKREANLDKIGYLSQTNYECSVEFEKVDEWVAYAVKCMRETTESIAVIKNGAFGTMSIGEFSARTNSKDAIPLTRAEASQFKDFLA